MEPEDQGMGEKEAWDRIPREKDEVWVEDVPLARVVCVFAPTADTKSSIKEGFPCFEIRCPQCGTYMTRE